MRGVDLGVASENYRIASHHTLRAKVVRWDRKRQIFGIHPEPATDSAALSVRFWAIFGRINGFWPPKTRCPAEGFIFSLYLNTVFGGMMVIAMVAAVAQSLWPRRVPGPFFIVPVRSFAADVGGLDDRPPQFGVGADFGTEFRRGRARNSKPERFELRFDRRVPEHRHDVGVHLLHNRLRRLSRHEQ